MPKTRRILSLWFPRLAAERVLRTERGSLGGPLAIVKTDNNSQFLSSLSPAAEAEGLNPGQARRDARAAHSARVRFWRLRVAASRLQAVPS